MMALILYELSEKAYEKILSFADKPEILNKKYSIVEIKDRLINGKLHAAESKVRVLKASDSFGSIKIWCDLNGYEIVQPRRKLPDSVPVRAYRLRDTKR